MLHLLITGRDAPTALIEAADLVTEMREVKHPLHTQGIRAQKGIEFDDVRATRPRDGASGRHRAS